MHADPFRKFNHCLHEAAKQGNEVLVRIFLSMGLPVFVTDVRAAIKIHSIEILALLLEYGWKINEPEAWCEPSPWCHAVNDPATEPVVSWCLRHGADPNLAAPQMDITPLSYAVAEAPLPIVRLLFAHCPPTTVFRGQLLHRAAGRHSSEGCDEVVQLVIDRWGPDINAVMYGDHVFSYALREFVGLRTALHSAARKGHLSVARILIAKGIDVSIRDSLGRTALDVAEQEGQADVAQLIRSKSWKL